MSPPSPVLYARRAALGRERTDAHPAGREFQKALYRDGIPATSFESSDIQAEYARVQARGVTFRTPPTPAGPVTVAVFDDTCGNLIQLQQAGGRE